MEAHSPFYLEICRTTSVTWLQGTSFTWSISSTAFFAHAAKYGYSQSDAEALISFTSSPEIQFSIQNTTLLISTHRYCRSISPLNEYVSHYIVVHRVAYQYIYIYFMHKKLEKSIIKGIFDSLSYITYGGYLPLSSFVSLKACLQKSSSHCKNHLLKKRCNGKFSFASVVQKTSR